MNPEVAVPIQYYPFIKHTSLFGKQLFSSLNICAYLRSDLNVLSLQNGVTTVLLTCVCQNLYYVCAPVN